MFTKQLTKNQNSKKYVAEVLRTIKGEIKRAFTKPGDKRVEGIVDSIFEKATGKSIYIADLFSDEIGKFIAAQKENTMPDFLDEKVIEFLLEQGIKPSDYITRFNQSEYNILVEAVKQLRFSESSKQMNER
jgi:hypothetical protein